MISDGSEGLRGDRREAAVQRKQPYPAAASGTRHVKSVKLRAKTSRRLHRPAACCVQINSLTTATLSAVAIGSVHRL